MKDDPEWVKRKKVMKMKLRTHIKLGLATAIYTTLSAGLSLANEWGPAVNIDSGGIIGINTPAVEGCPIESTNGNLLFFASNRPGGHGGIDIWVAFRHGPNDPWSDPLNLPINSAADDFCPTPLPGGDLLFVSRRAGGCSQSGSDIYQTRLHPVNGWLEPENLGCDVNSPGDEFSPSYAPAGGGMLFFSSNRDGLHKIYVSARLENGVFDSPTEVVELSALGFNSARPNVSQDGREIVFDSDRPGGFGLFDIWAATRDSAFDLWSAPFNLGPNVNSAAAETRPSLSRNGGRLLFGSTKAGGQGSSDIYVSER